MNDSALHLCDASADIAFGPAVEGCRDNFDFTIAFEQYFFSIAPSACFLLVAPLRLYYLCSKQPRVDGKGLRSLKLATIGVFASLQLASVISWATQNHSDFRVTSSVASSLSFVASLFLCALSYQEHSKSLRPSILLNAYLFITMLLDAVVLRTLWLASGNRLSRDIFTTSFALKGVIVFLEAKEKRHYLLFDVNGSPEDTSGLYSQTFLWWLNSIIKQGFGHILKPADLCTLDETLSSEVLNSRFWQEWNKPHRKTKHELAYAVTKMLRWPLVLPVFPRLALLGFTFCQPLLVGRLLAFLQKSDGQESHNIGYGLIGAYAAVYFGMAVSNSLYSHRTFKFLTMLRGTLVSAIYTKTTEISISALDDSAAVTLMSTDVERLVKGLRGMHDIWANIFQFILATWLLGESLAWACVAPVIVTAASAGITLRLSSTTQKTQLTWIMRIQKRIGVTSSMLGCIKGIKMAGLSRKLTSLVQNLRKDEVKDAKGFWLLGAYTSTLAFVPLMVSPVITFAIFVIIAAKNHSTLDAPRLFTSLSLLLLLTQPLFSLFGDIVDLRATFGCFQRIEKFLLSDTRSDHRLLSASLSEISSQTSRPENSHIGQTWTASSDDIELVNFTQASTSRSKAPRGSAIVSVRDGTFGWKEDGDPLLRDVNFEIQSSALVMIVGPVASGKSTLLKALLGETSSSKGFIHVSTLDIAWCEQTPWLSNTSVRNNILGFSNFDQELYKSVVHSCDLENDIDTFPNGDQTVVGSNGISLSNGQKQRLAIARAVYSRKKLAIFDDVFSSMDATTQSKVFDRVFGLRGLLRQWGITAILATHAVTLLPHADHIIALGSLGRIAEQGSFDKLNALDGYVRSFCLKSRHNDPGEETTAIDASTPNPPTSPQKKVSEAAASEDKAARQLGDWSIYGYYFQTIGWKLTCVFLLLEICWAFFSTFPTIWLKWYTDSNATQPNQHTGYYLGVYAALQVIGLIGFAFLTWFSFNIMAMKAGTRLHEITLETVMAAPMSFFSNTDTGSIVTRFSQDMQLIDGSLPLALMAVAANLFVCLGQMALIASAAYYVAISFPLLLAVFYAVQKYYLRTSRQMRFLDLEEKAPVYTQFIESLGGLATIRAFSWQKPSIERNHKLVDNSQKPFYLLFMIQTWLTHVLDLITMALAILVVAIAVRMRDIISVGFTGVSLTQIISFTANLKLCLLFWTQLETSIGAVARVKQFSSDTANENLASETQQPPRDWPRAGAVEFENVSAAYNADAENALSLISFSIRPGEKIGICGRTGSGKSTLTLALFRMIELTAGRITIDGLDISTIPRHHIRSRLNAMGADPYFINGSVRLNLDPHGTATDEAMVAALRKVGLWEVLALKCGLDAEYGDDMFSHGQRQLFCLARAMLRPGKVVVIDEVTSSVDLGTDALMQSLIRTEFQECTVITVAHRIDTILDYDRVVVVDNGKVAQVGSPTELLGQDSAFKRLFEACMTDRLESGKGKGKAAEV